MAISPQQLTIYLYSASRGHLCDSTAFLFYIYVVVMGCVCQSLIKKLLTYLLIIFIKILGHLCKEALKFSLGQFSNITTCILMFGFTHAMLCISTAFADRDGNCSSVGLCVCYDQVLYRNPSWTRVTVYNKIYGLLISFRGFKSAFQSSR